MNNFTTNRPKVAHEKKVALYKTIRIFSRERNYSPMTGWSVWMGWGGTQYPNNSFLFANNNSVVNKNPGIAGPSSNVFGLYSINNIHQYKYKYRANKDLEIKNWSDYLNEYYLGGKRELLGE
jgi:hypothetical protein